MINWYGVAKHFHKFKNFVYEVSLHSVLPERYLYSKGAYLADLYMLGVSPHKASIMVRRSIYNQEA